MLVENFPGTGLFSQACAHVRTMRTLLPASSLLHAGRSGRPGAAGLDAMSSR
jgi:hypothetical protein